MNWNWLKKWLGTYKSPIEDQTSLTWPQAQVYAKDGKKVAIFDWPAGVYVVWDKNVGCFCKVEHKAMTFNYKPTEIGCIWTVRL